MNKKNVLFALTVVGMLPAALLGLVVGFIVCGLRAGWRAAHYYAEWITT